jgi:hypothetical protein
MAGSPLQNARRSVGVSVSTLAHGSRNKIIAPYHHDIPSDSWNIGEEEQCEETGNTAKGTQSHTAKFPSMSAQPFVSHTPYRNTAAEFQSDRHVSN